MTYLDSVVHVCENNQIEIELVKKYLSTSIIDRLECEAHSLNFMKKGNTLDI